MNSSSSQMHPNSDLSILIVSWNTKALLAACLDSIRENMQQKPSTCIETFVVDNASTDGSVQMLREKYDWVHLIANKKNVGFASANNQAIRASCGRYVLLLNPDTVVKPGALEILLAYMESNPKVGAAGPLTLNPDGTLQTSAYPSPTLVREFWRLFHLDVFWPYGVYQMTTWDQNTPRAVDVLLGACIILRQEVIEQIGLMDETYFMYSEEVDLCHRIQKGGWSLYWVPDSKIIHYGGQSTKQVATEMFLHLYESKLLYFRKHHGWLAAQCYKILLFEAAITRLLFSPLSWLKNNPHRQQQQTLAHRYWQLVRALPGW